MANATATVDRDVPGPSAPALGMLRDRPEVGSRPAKQPASAGPLLVDVKELSRLLARSEASLHRDDSAGRIPAGLKLGSSKRWLYPEIVAWVEAGMPDRRTWQAMRGIRYAGAAAPAGGAAYRYEPSRN